MPRDRPLSTQGVVSRVPPPSRARALAGRRETPVGFRSGTKIPTACLSRPFKQSLPSLPRLSEIWIHLPHFPARCRAEGDRVDFPVSTCCWLQAVAAESRRHARTDAVGRLTTHPAVGVKDRANVILRSIRN